MAPQTVPAMAAAAAAESDLELAARLQRELNSLRGTRVRPASTANGVLGAPLGSCGATAALVARRATEESSSSSESDDDDASTEEDEEQEERRTELAEVGDAAAAAAARIERAAAEEEPGRGTTAADAARAEGGGVPHVGGSGSGGGGGGGGGGGSEGAAASDVSGDRSDGAASARGGHGDEAHRNVAAAKATGGNVALARWKDAVAATSRKGELCVCRVEPNSPNFFLRALSWQRSPGTLQTDGQHQERIPGRILERNPSPNPSCV